MSKLFFKLLIVVFVMQFSNSPCFSGDEIRYELYGDGRVLDSNDTIKLTFPNGFILLQCLSSDRFGNVIGPIFTNWFTTGTLDSIDSPTNKTRIFYSAANIAKNEEGYIIARIDSLISLRVFVKITGEVKIVSTRQIYRKNENHNGIKPYMINGRSLNISSLSKSKKINNFYVQSQWKSNFPTQ